MGYIVLKQLCLDSKITSWGPKNRIPRQKLRIYSNSEVWRATSRSKYLKMYLLISFMFNWFLGLFFGIFGPRSQNRDLRIRPLGGKFTENLVFKSKIVISTAQRSKIRKNESRNCVYIYIYICIVYLLIFAWPPKGQPSWEFLQKASGGHVPQQVV